MKTFYSKSEKEKSLRELRKIPGVGVSVAQDLWNIGIRSITDLRHQDANVLYDLSNNFEGIVQDRCL